MSISNNPATRLLHILKRAKLIEGTATGNHAWMKLFKIEDNDQIVLMRCLAKTMDLPNKVLKDMDLYYPNNTNLHNHWHQNVSQAFMTYSSNKPWQEFKSQIDIHTTNYLGFTATLLDEKIPTQNINSEEIANLLNAVEEVIEIVSSADDISNEFKIKTLEKLKTIKEDIFYHNLTGAESIHSSLEQVLGKAVVDENYREELNNTETGKKLKAFLKKGLVVVSAANETFQLGSTILKLLG